MHREGFKEIFGVEPKQIQPACVLLPFVRRSILAGLGIERLNRGALYGVAQGDGFSVISSGIGSGLVGDALDYLIQAGCRRAFLYGACGLVSDIGRVGDLVVPIRNLSRDSFLDWLLPVLPPWVPGQPDQGLANQLAEVSGAIRATNASVASIKLAQEQKKELVRDGIESVEMECGAFFSVAGRAQIPAAALLVGTDMVGSHPFYLRPSPVIFSSFEKGARALCRLLTGN